MLDTLDLHDVVLVGSSMGTGESPAVSPTTDTRGSPSSPSSLRSNPFLWNLAVTSGPIAAYAVVPSWIEDFRGDVADVRPAGKRIVILHEIEGAPHGLLRTHADDVINAPATFLAR